jgi:hypothetical protein
VADPVLDRVVFARDVLGLDLFPHQVEAVRSTAPMTAIFGGRRSGKTVAAEVVVLHHALTRRGVDVIVTAPNENSIKERMRELMALVRGAPRMEGAVTDEQSMTIALANGSRVIGLVPTPGNLRGPRQGRLLRLGRRERLLRGVADA